MNIKFNNVELVFSFADFNLKVLSNEIFKLNLELGFYFVDLYIGDRKVGSLKPLYINCKSEEVFKEKIFGLYNNILLVIPYLNLNTGLEDNKFKLVITKDLFIRYS